MSYVNVGGVWKNGTDYVNVGGVWKGGTDYVNVGGVWKQAAGKDGSQLFYVGYPSAKANLDVNPIEVLSDGSLSNLKIKFYPYYGGGGDIWVTFVPAYNPNKVSAEFKNHFLVTPYISSKVSDLIITTGRGYGFSDKYSGGVGKVVCNGSIESEYTQFANGVSKEIIYTKVLTTNFAHSLLMQILNANMGTRWAQSDYIIFEWYDAYIGNYKYHTKK